MKVTATETNVNFRGEKKILTNLGMAFREAQKMSNGLYKGHKSNKFKYTGALDKKAEPVKKYINSAIKDKRFTNFLENYNKYIKKPVMLVDRECSQSANLRDIANLAYVFWEKAASFKIFENIFKKSLGENFPELSKELINKSEDFLFDIQPKVDATGGRTISNRERKIFWGILRPDLKIN